MKCRECEFASVHTYPRNGNSNSAHVGHCLLYTSDAADEEDSVELGGRRVIKKKKKSELAYVEGMDRQERGYV